MTSQPGHDRGQSPTVLSHTFCRAHLYKAILAVLSFLVLFEFSSMLLSQEKTLWIPSFTRYSLTQLGLSRNPTASDARVLSCNKTGCWYQFGNAYDLANEPGNRTAALFLNETELVVNGLVGLSTCPEKPPKLVGAVKVLLEKLPEEEILKSNTELEPGGRFRPRDCVARHKVAIILPYRDRAEHLRVFLNNIHPILQRQQLDYGIFVVEQAGTGKFNRGAEYRFCYYAVKRYCLNCARSWAKTLPQSDCRTDVQAWEEIFSR